MRTLLYLSMDGVAQFHRHCIVTQRPVSIVSKLYQFQIVTVVELRSVYSQLCHLTYCSQYS